MMRIIAAVFASALMALSAPAIAQAASGSTSKELKQNGSPTGVAPSHAKMKGARDTESGPAPKEGRSSATDTNGKSNMKSNSATSTESNTK
jgi:hypothetical protein